MHKATQVHWDSVSVVMVYLSRLCGMWNASIWYIHIFVLVWQWGKTRLCPKTIKTGTYYFDLGPVRRKLYVKSVHKMEFFKRNSIIYLTVFYWYSLWECVTCKKFQRRWHLNEHRCHMFLGFFCQIHPICIIFETITYGNIQQFLPIPLYGTTLYAVA